MYDRLNSSNSIVLDKAQELCKPVPPIYYKLVCYAFLYSPYSLSRPQCTEIVNVTYFRVVDIVESDLTPEEVCQKVGLCRSFESSTRTPPQIYAEASTLLCSIFELLERSTSKDEFTQQCKPIFTSDVVS